jgi:hypothetical protein
VLKRIVEQGIGTAFSDPGKPWQNGVNPSFNGTFGDQCPSLEWFGSQAEAKVVIETWGRHCTTVRPHSSRGSLTPAALAATPARQTAAPATATGRGAAPVRGFAPGPLPHRPARDIRSQQQRDQSRNRGTPRAIRRLRGA